MGWEVARFLQGDVVQHTDYDLEGSPARAQSRSMSKGFIPFRYQGQYEDTEIGLYYNRFRYYSPDFGTYISQDPIRLAGGLAFYGYTFDSNTEVDVWGLSPKEIKEKFSLPEVPTHKTTVVVPKGTRISSGKINLLLSFGGIDKNAKQIQLLERIPDECFKNTKPLKKEH